MIGNNSNWVKAYIVDVLPCISIAFFVLAFVYNNSFFSVFGIDILQYATFGDIFMSITEHLCIFALFCFGINLIAWLLIKREIRLSEEDRKKHLNNKNIDSFISKLLSYVCMAIILVFFLTSFFIDEYEKYIASYSESLPLFLYVPVLVAIFYIYYFYVKNNSILLIESIKRKPQKFFSFLLIYYIYSIFIFTSLGVENGIKRRDTDSIKFEIRTTGGYVYNNAGYRYVCHISDNTFLYNKKTKENLILYNDNIEYSNIIDNGFKLNLSVKSFNHRINNYAY